MKKFTKLASIFLAIPLIVASCDVLSATKELTAPNSVSTDKSAYSLPVDGGEVSIAVTSAYDWSSKIEAASSIDDISGMFVSPDYAVASTKAVKATVKAGKNTGYDRSALVSFIGTGGSCAVTINQAGELGPRIDVVSVTEFLAKPVDASVYYEITGRISAITNEKYNDFNITDGKSEVLVYGLYDGRGGASLPQYWLTDNGITAGYTVTIRATRGDYNGTPEALKAYLVGDPQPPVDPMLICEAPSLTVAAAATGASFDLMVKNLKEGWKVTPAEKYDWITSYTAEGTESGSIDLEFTANTSKEDVRVAKFTVTSAGAAALELELIQEAVPDIYDGTIAEFKAAEVSTDKWYRLTGVVTSIVNDTYGNLYIADATDTVYVYGVLPEKGSTDKKNFKKLGIKEHDILTVIGNRGEYKGTIQATNAYYEDNKTTTPVTLAEFLTKEESTELWYEVTATVTSIYNATYGNIYLNDGTTTDDVYAYGCYIGWGATGDLKKLFPLLGVEVGDEITMIGNKGAYKGTPQITNGIFISKNESPVPVEPTFSVEPTTLNAKYTETSAKFNVKGNVAWTVTCPAGITAEPASGEGEAEVALKFAQNQGDQDLKYEITVATTAEVEVPSVTVTLNQACNRLPATVAELIAAIPEDATDETKAQRFDVNLNGVVVSGIYQDKNIMLEDKTGGIQLIEAGSAYFEGAVISGKASVKAYASQGRAVITSLDKCKITGYTQVPCTTLTIDELKADFDSYIGKRVLIKDVKVTKQCKATSANADRQGEITSGASSIMLYTYHKENEVWVTKDSEGSVMGYPIAYISGTSSTKELTFWGNEDFSYTKCNTVLEGVPAKMNLMINRDTTITVLTNSSMPVQYQSSNPAVATVDANGKITSVAKGKCTITVSIAASGPFAAITKVCTLKVIDSPDLVLQFPDDNSAANKCNQYTNTWTAKTGTFEFTVANFSNNNWADSWSGTVRCGRKSNTSVAYIATKAAINYEVDNVAVTFPAVSKTDKIKSAKLIVASNAAFTANVQSIDFTVVAGTVTIPVANPGSNLYYKVQIDMNSTGSNGCIQLKKIVYQQ